MSKNEKWFLYFSNFLTSASGWIYAWMVYFLKPVNEWDIFNHPWQKHLQALHILVVPLLIFAVGIIWKKHIQVRLFKSGQKRKITGWLLIMTLAPMIFSGYLLQVSTDAHWRDFYSYLHLFSSGGWTFIFMIHLSHWIPRRELIKAPFGH